MRIPVRAKSCTGLLLPLAAVALYPAIALAQWVPRQGTGSISLNYQYTSVKYHLFSADVAGVVDPSTGYVGGPGNKWDIGHITGQSADFSAEYGLVRHFGLSAEVNYIASRYAGRDPESSLDNGKYHGTPRDVSLGARYMFNWNEFAMTPEVGFSFPTHDYPSMGHTSAGRALDIGTFGLAVGRSLDPWLPQLIVDGSFSYLVVENVGPYTLDQHRYTAEVSYGITRSIYAGGTYSFVSSVDGVDWLTTVFTPEIFMIHDQAAKERSAHIGGFFSYSMPGGKGLYVSYVATVSGQNTHAANSLTIGTSWDFSTRWAPHRAVR